MNKGEMRRVSTSPPRTSHGLLGGGCTRPCAAGHTSELSTSSASSVTLRP